MNETNLQEEVFCLQFELNILSEVILKSESERWVPGFVYRNVEHDHIKRYELAAKYVKDKSVLDIACGVGKGSYYLAETGNAKAVTGYDISEDAIRYAKHRNSHPLVSFQVQNAETYLINNAYDVAVSFETIEHLIKYDCFLKNIAGSLKENGLFIVSTPISNQAIDTNPLNPYHIQEWGFEDFQKVINKYFSIVEVYVQLYHSPKPILLRNNFFSKASRRIKHLFRKRNVLGPESINATNLSVLEKFTNQYSWDELGNNRIGYQILIAKKNA